MVRVGAAQRQLGVGIAIASLAVVTLLAGAAQGQIAVPKYQSPIEAPAPQPPSLPAPVAITPNATVVEYPVARVNDAIIDSSDYLRAQHQLLQDAQQANASAADLAQSEKNLLRDMIDKQLLLSRGKDLDLDSSADTEVIRRLDDIRKQNHFDTMEELERAVRESGISYEDFKESIKDQIIQQEVVRDEVGRKLSLTGKQEQAYYDAHKQDFAQPEQVRLSEILIPTPDDATDAQVAQAQAKANEVEAKLKAGAKFDDLAKQYSGGQTADKGGDLGEFKRGAMAKVLEDQTFDLKAGQYTAPIRTKQGFVVLEVTEHTQAGIPPLSAVEEQVQEAIYEQAIQPALRVYLTDLRQKAYIWIEPGFVDTGASPNETKSIFVGATPPPTKKKSARKKERLEAAAEPAPGPAGASSLLPSGTAVSSNSSAAASTAAAVPSATAAKPAVTPVKLTRSGKPKKIKREKIRYGQAPRNALPPGPEQIVTAGADQGAGAASSTLAPGAIMASTTQEAASADLNPLADNPAPEHKTRYSDRAPVEAKEKAAAKVAKLKETAAQTPPPMTAEEKTVQKLQDASLSPDSANTNAKKKKKRQKGEAKERLQQQPPAPPAPKPEATPIPPKSVRDNGEPAVTPAPDPSTLPPVTPPPSTAAPAQPPASSSPTTAAPPQ